MFCDATLFSVIKKVKDPLGIFDSHSLSTKYIVCTNLFWVKPNKPSSFKQI